jgi:Ca-activated chloride channel family protein
VKIAATLFAMFAGITLAAQQPSPGVSDSRPTFRAAVELTVVLVNVTDRDNHAATPLAREDFVLLENGAPQPIAHFLSAGGAVDVVLLVDVSGSITPVLSDLRQVATDFVDALRPGDRVMVVGFDHRVRPLCQLTDDREELERALGRVRPSGSTSLFDSVYISVKTIASTSSDFARRRAIVVISDGEDTSSILQPREVREQSMRYGVPIYMILLEQAADAVRDRFGSYELKRRRFDVKSLALETGGRTFLVGEGRGLKDAYRSIVDDLSQQYVLAYERSRDAVGALVTVQIPSRPSALVKTHMGQSRTRGGG